MTEPSPRRICPSFLSANSRASAPEVRERRRGRCRLDFISMWWTGISCHLTFGADHQGDPARPAGLGVDLIDRDGSIPILSGLTPMGGAQVITIHAEPATITHRSLQAIPRA